VSINFKLAKRTLNSVRSTDERIIKASA